MPELSADDRIDLEAGGLIRVDKPVGWTSFDVVNKVRYALKALAGKRVKVGHAGTLDPLASGLLLLGYGPGT
ncbi:MAG: tRNA pseudouridine(55) synthase, partial [Flavobacteriales bacterium]|nr:tRNA pseudouridine(55) synthase [Flavobacteriales bacterium]